jgi:outer membrane protein TolC
MRIALVFLFCLYVSVRAPAAQPLDLEAAIDLALRQNASLKIAALNCDSRRIALDSAHTAFAVKLSPGAGWRKSDDTEQRQLGLAASRKTSWGTTLELSGESQQRLFQDASDYHRDSVRVRLSQPLLQQFGPLMNREPIVAAEQAALRAERELELRKADIVLQVVETYEQLFLLQQQESFDQVRLRRLERMRRLTAAKEKQGRAGRVDVLRVELQYGEAESRLNQTRERLTAIRAELAELLGLPASADLEAVRAAWPDIEMPDAAQAVAVAMERRLDFAQVLADCEDAARGVKIARRNLLPDIRWITELERYGEGDTASRAQDLDRDAWLVALTLNTADVLRRDERIALRQAVLNEKTARVTAASSKRALERQVQQAVAAYARAKAELPLAERNCALAEARMRVAQRMFEIGRGDGFSVSDAEEALLQAQNRLLAAQSEAVITAYRLLRALGMLLETPEHLKPPSPSTYSVMLRETEVTP